MAYACPVCDVPQADGEHLANHLAFTALLHDDEHADWLSEQVGEWEDRTPAELAEVVVENAEEIDHEFDDHDHGEQPRIEGELSQASGQGRVPEDPETRRIVEEAIELTEQMYDPEDEESQEE